MMTSHPTADSTAHRIAIIGAGTAGLSCAQFLAHAVFHAKLTRGGLVGHFWVEINRERKYMPSGHLEVKAIL